MQPGQILPRDWLCLEFAEILSLPFPVSSLEVENRALQGTPRAHWSPRATWGEAAPGGPCILQVFRRVAEWLGQPEESPGMEVMLIWPIYILIGWISHRDPPTHAVSSLINNCSIEASVGMSAWGCFVLPAVSPGLELPWSQIALDEA